VRTGRRSGRLLPVLLLAAGACLFERRPDPESPSLLDSGLDPELPAEARPPDPADAAAHLTEVFRDAVRIGDLSLALGLLDRNATLRDELAGAAVVGDPEGVTRGELLLEIRRMYEEGIRLHPTRVAVDVLGETAVVTTELEVLRRVEPEGELAVQEGRAWETAVLVATPEGWRIRHLHRSFHPLD
jgi:hypothetical protein